MAKRPELMPSGEQAVPYRRPTMAEIAKAAGVSAPTVSKVLNKRRDVSSATRARVEAVIAQRGYVTNRAAQALWTGRSGFIHLVVYGLENAYDYAIIRGVERALEGAGERLVLTALYGEAKKERQWLAKLIDGSTDGAILVLADQRSPHLQELQRRSIPFVVIDDRGELGHDVPSVGSTNWAGGRAATDYLLSLGHRRIAMLCGAPSFLSAQARLAGYRAALETAGVAPEPELIRPGRFLREDGYAQTNALLDLSRPPTAIFAGNDMQALGAYQALRERGVAVPERMSVVGFDNDPISGEVWPGLTTIHQPLSEMGRVATSMLLRLINGEPLDSMRVEVATSLVVRESCAPPAG